MNDPSGWDAVVERRTIDLGGTSVRYTVAGEQRSSTRRAGSDDAANGPSVVLLHGGGLDSASLSWREALPVLAETHRVYAPDFPGYGGSDDPGSYSTESYVDFVVAFLDALDLDRVFLVGISMGGGVALGLTLRNPARVDRLVLVDSYGLGGTVPGGALSYYFVRLPFVSEFSWTALQQSRTLTRMALRGIVHQSNLTDVLVDEAHRELQRPGAGRAFGAFQRAEVGHDGLRTDYSDALSGVDVPTLLVHGESDPLVPVEWAERAATAMPDAELRTLAQCGHWPPRERPHEFNRIVGGFLATAD